MIPPIMNPWKGSTGVVCITMVFNIFFLLLCMVLAGKQEPCHQI
jgi:hypothetical protein